MDPRKRMAPDASEDVMSAMAPGAANEVEAEEPPVPQDTG
jgi:hypothetical protein